MAQLEHALADAQHSLHPIASPTRVRMASAVADPAARSLPTLDAPVTGKTGLTIVAMARRA
jgi:hypothetical protein